MVQILFAKQPILDRKQQTIAHELLYRAPVNAQNPNTGFDDNHATAQVLVGALNEISLTSAKELLFINFPKDLLFTPPPIKTNNLIVIEILETVSVDDALINQVTVLKKMGYKLALDDYQGSPLFERLLPLMDIIKVEVLGLNLEQLTQIVLHLKPYSCKLLAEKVENQSMFDDCLDLGFDYFQGFFFSKPINVHGNKMSQNQLSLIRLMAKIYDSDISLHELSEFVSHDPEICVGLLKLVNGPLFKRSNTVNSISQACSILGLTELRNWVQLLSFAKLDDRPEMFNFQSLLCGIMMKNVAQYHPNIDSDEAFTVGICAHIETILDLPIEIILDNMPFDEHMKLALSKQSGELGKLLKFCIFYIDGQWENLDWQWLKQSMSEDHLLPSIYEKAYLEARQSFR